MARLHPVVLGALVALLAGCAAAPTAATDTLVVAQQSETRDLLSIDPLKTMDVSLPTFAVYDTLLRRGSDGAAEPALAESFAQDDRGWVLTLRQGVTFTDGSALDSADVKATVEHMLDPANATSYARILAGVSGVQAPDPRTVVLTMATPNEVLPKALTLVPVVSSDQLARGEVYRTELIGTGPYRLARWNRGQSVVLERNEGYWGAKPAYARVEVKLVPEPSGRVAELASGAAGIAADLLPTQLATIPTDQAGVLREPSVRSAYVQIIPAGPLADPAVRQALYRSVDRAALTATVAGDTAEPAVSVVPSHVAGYSPTFPLTDHDPAAARAALAGAGQAGPVRVVLDATPDMSAAAQLLQSQVREGGFEATINLVDSRAALFDAKRARADGAPRLLLTTALDDRTFDALRPFSAVMGTATPLKNYGYPPDQATQDLINAYAAAPDQAARDGLSAQVQRSAKAQMATIFLYYPQELYAVAKTVCWDSGGRSQLDLTRMRPCG